MVLGFYPQFVPKILAGTKIHSIREDAHDRWHAGRSIQMATGVRTLDYNCFAVHQCISTQKITITTKSCMGYRGPCIKIDGMRLSALQMHDLAVADGFDNVLQFFDWFNTDFTGKIIHWTSLNY